jgi:hypothetical protein
MTLPDWQTYISIGKDVITGLAAAAGGTVAVLGLRAWRKQLQGKTEYELARRCLRAVYGVRDAFRIVRSPIQTAEELTQAFRESGDSPPDPNDSQLNLIVEQTVYDFRWKRLNEAFSDLDVELLEAEVLWGAATQAAVWPLRECRRVLFTATRRHLLRLKTRLPPQRLTTEEEEDLDRTVYEIHGDDSPGDSFAQGVKHAIEKVEIFLKPHLKL